MVNQDGTQDGKPQNVSLYLVVAMGHPGLN